jgi:hypothetical protein
MGILFPCLIIAETVNNYICGGYDGICCVSAVVALNKQYFAIVCNPRQISNAGAD